MNSDFFRFWRYIQRFTLGTIVSTEILFFVVGLDRFQGLFNVFFAPSSNPLGILNNTVILIAVVLAFGSIGTLLCNVFISFAIAATQPLFKRMFPIKILSSQVGWTRLLFRSGNELTLKLIQSNINEHIEHFSLRTFADPHHIEMSSYIETYYKRLTAYILNIKDFDHFTTMVYQGTLTQEQRNLDNLKWDIDSVSTLIVILLIGAVNLYVYHYVSIFMFFIFVIMIFVFSAPELLNRKQKYISYLVAVCGAIFQLADPGQIADRDSI